MYDNLQIHKYTFILGILCNDTYVFTAMMRITVLYENKTRITKIFKAGVAICYTRLSPLADHLVSSEEIRTILVA